MTAELSDEELERRISAIHDLPIEQRAEALDAAEKTLRNVLNAVDRDQ
jgi:hypothetical protein